MKNFRKNIRFMFHFGGSELESDVKHTDKEYI